MLASPAKGKGCPASITIMHPTDIQRKSPWLYAQPALLRPGPPQLACLSQKYHHDGSGILSFVLIPPQVFMGRRFHSTVLSPLPHVARTTTHHLAINGAYLSSRLTFRLILQRSCFFISLSRTHTYSRHSPSSPFTRPRRHTKAHRPSPHHRHHSRNDGLLVPLPPPSHLASGSHHS